MKFFSGSEALRNRGKQNSSSGLRKASSESLDIGQKLNLGEDFTTGDYRMKKLDKNFFKNPEGLTPKNKQNSEEIPSSFKREQLNL